MLLPFPFIHRHRHHHLRHYQQQQRALFACHTDTYSLANLCLGIKIKTRGNYVTLITSKQAEIYFMNCILIK